MGARRLLTRATFVTLVAAVTVANTLTGPSAAAQPDSIEDQIAAADAELKAAQTRLADTYETFTVAQQRYQDLSAAVSTAQGEVTRTRAEADAATTREQDTRQELDRLASASYRHGTAMFSARAYLGVRDPDELLDRASMLTLLAGEYGDVMDDTRVAVHDKAEADRQAQAALDAAETSRDDASSAKAVAEQAYDTAVATQGEAQAKVARLADRRAALAAQSKAAASDDAGSGAGSGAGSDITGAAVVLPAHGTLTSTYGARWGTVHWGIDIANSIGTPILSAMAGEVISSGPASGFGLWVRVRHAGGLITVYGHINESLVSIGQQVAAGQQIATIGNRGESTGPHLHFEVHEGETKIDPLPWLRGHGVAI